MLKISQTDGVDVKRTAGADVKHPLRIATVEASIGREAGLQRSPRKGRSLA